MMLRSDQKKLIRSDPIKMIVGAYEHGNDKVLDYALSVATPRQRDKARQKAIWNGLDVDYIQGDDGTHWSDR